MGKFDKYVVRVDGTGRITTRNRGFLKKAEPYQHRQPGPGPDRGPEIVKGSVQEPLRTALAKELEQKRGERLDDTVPLVYNESLVENTVED